MNTRRNHTSNLSEDFTGQVLPTGWTNVDNISSGQVWEFDNPGGRVITGSNFDSDFAILDSDNYGSGGDQDILALMDFFRSVLMVQPGQLLILLLQVQVILIRLFIPNMMYHQSLQGNQLFI